MSKQFFKMKKMSVRKKDIKGNESSCLSIMGCFGFFAILILFFAFCSESQPNDDTDKVNLQNEEKSKDSVITQSIAELSRINDVDSFIILNRNTQKKLQSIVLSHKEIHQHKLESITIKQIDSFFNEKKFDITLKLLSSVDSLNPTYEKNDTLRYIKAISLKELGKRKEAAEYLYNLYRKSDRLIELENELNPIKKIFSHYQALCYDGIYKEWTATRKGTCRNHGGVNKWNGKAVYISKRTYEF